LKDFPINNKIEGKNLSFWPNKEQENKRGDGTMQATTINVEDPSTTEETKNRIMVTMSNPKDRDYFGP